LAIRLKFIQGSIGIMFSSKASDLRFCYTAGMITKERACIGLMLLVCAAFAAGKGGDPEPESARESGLSTDMVFVEGGTFMMGTPPEAPYYFYTERQHKVSVSDYYIGKYEVTRKLWKDVMGHKLQGALRFGADKLPEQSVSWFDALEFCNRLSQRDGLAPAYRIDPVARTVAWNREADGYRLPTEAEWEYAARGGKYSPGYLYSGSNTPDDVGWHAGNSDLRSHPVGRKAGNELAIHDMSGNVAEWCWDWFDLYPSSEVTDPIGPWSSFGFIPGGKRIVRGGSSFEGYGAMRVTFRHSWDPLSSSNCGFRVARGLLSGENPVETSFFSPHVASLNVKTLYLWPIHRILATRKMIWSD